MNRLASFTFLLLLLTTTLFISCKKNKSTPVEPEPIVTKPIEVTPPTNKWGDYAEKGQDAINKYFYNSSENYFKQSISNNGFNYWWNAHALDVKIDAYNRTKDVKYVAQMKNILRGAFNKNGKKYKNDFYDDMEWWTISCLRAYDATKDVEYKNVAIELWGYIKLGWTDDNNGGILWKKGLTSKNSCSNGPAAIIAARLYLLDKNQDDLNWALKIYEWEKKYLVNPANGLVWDSYGNFNDGWRFTYNQGTYIGAAVELYTITKDIKYLNDAIQTTNSVTNGTSYNTSGILKGEGVGDGGLFKGIFIRYMIQLIIKGDIDATTKTRYTDYLVKNAESLVNNATRSIERYYGPSWRAMPTTDENDSSVQFSGLMLLEGVNELWRLNHIK